MDFDQIKEITLAIDPWSVVAAVCLFILVVIGLDRFYDAGSRLKEKLFDRKFNKIIKRTENGETTLREEFRVMYNEANSEHDEFRKRLDDHERYLSNDKKEIDSLKIRVNDIVERVEVQTQEGTLMIRTAKVLLNNQLGISKQTDVKEVVDEIDKFLIERRDK